MVDCWENGWPQLKARFPHLRRWLINVDNGSDNHSRGTQLMARLMALAQRKQLTIQWAF
ncbi:MAG: hypothetical protein AAGG53_08080 [Cyanobacteria bacterium P01_H01_bin.152]